MKIKTTTDFVDHFHDVMVPEGSVVEVIKELQRSYKGVWTSRYGTYTIKVPKDACVLYDPDEEYNARIRNMIREGSKDLDRKVYIPPQTEKTTIPFLALCVVDYSKIPEDQHHYYLETFLPQDQVIFLGEIPNMRGHCVVVHTKTKAVEIGWHTEIFRECTEDEV